MFVLKGLVIVALLYPCHKINSYMNIYTLVEERQLIFF